RGGRGWEGGAGDERVRRRATLPVQGRADRSRGRKARADHRRNETPRRRSRAYRRGACRRGRARPGDGGRNDEGGQRHRRFRATLTCLLAHDLFRPAFARQNIKPHVEIVPGLRAGGNRVPTLRDHAALPLVAGPIAMAALLSERAVTEGRAEPRGRAMSRKRRSYEAGHKPKYLVIIDGSPECDRAVYYASRRAARTGASGLMLP